MMKSPNALLTAVVFGTLLCAGPTIAQDAQLAPASGQVLSTATMNTSVGELTVNSTMPAPPPAGPAPAFDQLSGGGKYITQDQASAYPLLANDFLYADQNRDGRISKSEYKRWTARK